jgi:hypothetical protein
MSLQEDLAPTLRSPPDLRQISIRAEAEWLRAETFYRKNPCPEEANISVWLSILLGVAIVKKIYMASNSLNRM